jgi:hypothetical protein
MTFYFLISLKIIIKKSSTQLVEKVKNDTIQGDDADTTNTILNNQSQSYTTENNNDEHLNKHTDDKMKALEDSFHIKMGLMEVNNDIVQKELAALKQKERHQDEENKRLKERLARMEAAMQGDVNNDSHNDSSDGGDSDNATNNVGVSEGKNIASQKEVAALKENEYLQDEEHRQLIERVAGIEAGVQDDPNNDLNYDSYDSEIDNELDINYDSECSNNEEEDTINKNIVNTQRVRTHHTSVETNADPNYDSSDNEDRRNDIYLD